MAWAPQKGELIGERFLLEDLLARGGMGSVWVAHHVTLDSPCAVKFIDENYARVPELRKRFEGEARAAAKLRSRHVVQILDYGVWKGAPYIAMELLEGETLADRLERERRLSPLETLTVLQGVVRALSKARVLEIVHRDLKPENIFLVTEGEQEFAKVLDFGIAKLRDPNSFDEDGRTNPGAPLGTPFYMSPEQADGTIELDYRSDLWSLGIIAFECLTGDVPFHGEAYGNLITKVMSGPIPMPSDFDAELPEAVDEWWKRASERDRDKRYQTAGELYEELEAALSADGDVVIPPDRPSRVSWITPRRVDWAATSRPPASSDAPPQSQQIAKRDELQSGEFAHGWSSPHRSAVPPDSERPPLAAKPQPAPTVETLAGHTRSIRFGRRSYVAAAVGIVAIGVIAWLALRGDEPTPAAAPTINEPTTMTTAPLARSAAPEVAPPPSPSPSPSLVQVAPRPKTPGPLPTMLPVVSATASASAAPPKWETGY